MALDLLICASTDLECAWLRERLHGRDRSVEILRTGVGAVNAAHALTLAIQRQAPSQVLVCGIGGAYPNAGLSIGDVVCASAETYGDLGAESPSGFLDMQALGFAVIDGAEPRFNDLPLQLFPLDRRVRFVTVNTCTGTHQAALALEARTGGAVENMEGAALAHVALLHGVPIGEVRGISNIVTNRDRAAWRVRDAVLAAQEAVLAWIDRR